VSSIHQAVFRIGVLKNVILQILAIAKMLNLILVTFLKMKAKLHLILEQKLHFHLGL